MARIRHIAIQTQDEEAAKNFYVEHFGLQVVKKLDSDRTSGYFLTDGQPTFSRTNTSTTGNSYDPLDGDGIDAAEAANWTKFLSDNAVWNGKGGQVDGTWTFSVPIDGYYAVSGSCDNWGTAVWIDGMQVLDIRDFNNAWLTSVWLKAGSHSIRVYGKDTGGDYGIAVTVESSNTVFNLKNFAMRNWGWTPRTDDGWCNFLNANAVWNPSHPKEFNQGTQFQVPAKAYYTVTASCDDSGYVEIDSKRVVTVKEANFYDAFLLIKCYLRHIVVYFFTTQYHHIKRFFQVSFSFGIK